MEINNINKTQNNKNIVKKTGAGGKTSTLFDNLINSGNDNISIALDGISNVSHLFSLQETIDYIPQKTIIERGKQLLNVLQEMRNNLLQNNLSMEQLNIIIKQLKSYEGQSDNIKLNELLDEIKTRVLVELAKFGYDVE